MKAKTAKPTKPKTTVWSLKDGSREIASGSAPSLDKALDAVYSAAMRARVQMPAGVSEHSQAGAKMATALRESLRFVAGRRSGKVGTLR